MDPMEIWTYEPVLLHLPGIVGERVDPVEDPGTLLCGGSTYIDGGDPSVVDASKLSG